MLVREAKLLNGTGEQYAALDNAIRTAQFIRNKAVRCWMDGTRVSKNDLQKLCKLLAEEFEWARKLNSMARQASADRAWQAIACFYRRCQEGARDKGYPKFKKHSSSVEYKTSGWALSEDCKTIIFTDGFKAGAFSIYANQQTREDLATLKINRVRVVRRADGYYAQFCFDTCRQEQGHRNGRVVGLDLGLTYFFKDNHDNAAVYPKFLRQSEKRLKLLQRRLSRKHQRGKKQSANYHEARIRLGKAHLKVQRQRKEWAIEQARCVVSSHDVVVYEDLQIQNLVKNHHLAKAISDAAWSQFTRWLDYYGQVWSKAVVAVNPAFTTQACSNCGQRVKKSLSTRTHQCGCGASLCRDTNAARNILQKGLVVLGAEWNHSTSGQEGTAGRPGTPGETSTAAVEGQPDTVSGVAEPGIRIPFF